MSELEEHVRALARQVVREELRRLPPQWEWLTVEQTARLLGVTTKAVYSKLEVIPKGYPGAKQPPHYVSDGATGLREAAVLPLDCIVDENRAVEWNAGWSTVAEAARRLLPTLPLDPWTGDAPVPFPDRGVALARRALSVLSRGYRADVAALDGQSSLSLCNEIAQALPPWTRALVLTDFDKSGADIERSAKERILALRSEPLELVWDRLAITEEQIAEHSLTVIEKYDARTKRRHPAVETEALGQDEIERIVRGGLDESLAEHGHDSLATIVAEEECQRAALREILDRDEP